MEKPKRELETTTEERAVNNYHDRVKRADDNGFKILQHSFERVVSESLSVKINKIVDYGTGKYTEEDKFFTLSLAYADVYRKFVRLKKLTEHVRDENNTPEERLDAAEKLESDYKDLLNYAIDGVIQADRVVSELITINEEINEEINEGDIDE